jgi:cob(I)alamin adenosyltransferase
MPKIDAMLGRVQNDLFDLGSDLATPGADAEGARASLRIVAGQVGWLEGCIDQFNAGLQPLTSFVLPGGTPLAAHLHVSRTLVRRAERLAVALRDTDPTVNPEALKYLNRLSDLLFVLARVANGNGARDVLWAPGRFREDQGR